VPALLLAALAALAYLAWDVPQIARFDFLWDAFLGLALGVGLGLLPAWTGVPRRPNASAGLYWVGAFLALALLCAQYVGLVTGLVPFQQAWLARAAARGAIAEGAVLGFCLVHTRR
jgi:hypothetical protein